MGIAGSAWGSLWAQVISLAALIVYLRKSHHVLWLGRRYINLYRIRLPILRILVFKGIPMGVQMIVISLAAIAMMTMVNRHGSYTAAAYSATMQLWSYVQMPAMAIGAACSTFAAQSIGAGRWDKVSETIRYGVIFNFVMTGALTAAILFFDRWTLAIFLPSGSEAFDIARHLNSIAIWSFMFFGVSFVVSGVIRASGTVIPPLLILCVSMWGIRVPFASFFSSTLGVDAIWWSFPASACCSMLMSIFYYRYGKWRTTKLLPT